jgi:hypothetical protein
VTISVSDRLDRTIVESTTMCVPAKRQDAAFLVVSLIALGHVLFEDVKDAHHADGFLQDAGGGILVLLQDADCIVQRLEPVHARLDKVFVNLHLVEIIVKLIIIIFQEHQKYTSDSRSG